MSKGYVYILSNPSMPGLVKIGKTTRNVEQRAQELWQTGVPTPFVIHASFFSPNCDELEAMAHGAFHEKRVHGSREFFHLEPEVAKRQLDCLHYEQIEPMLAEYLPDHVPVRSELAVDDSVFCLIGLEYDMEAADVVSVLDAMIPSDFGPILERVKAERAARDAKRSPYTPSVVFAQFEKVAK